MVLGAIVCSREHARDVAVSLREVRSRHQLSRRLEIKWGRVSPAKLAFYLDVLKVFWQDPDLRFRAVIASKQNLQHQRFEQTYDDWYYKMYYQLLNPLITKRGNEQFRIYLDIKDTQSSGKMRKLHEVLCNGIYDFNQEVIDTVLAVRSHEVALVQLADLFAGALAYSARNLHESPAKLDFLRELQHLTGRPLNSSTWLSERKFNIFRWEPQQ